MSQIFLDRNRQERQLLDLLGHLKVKRLMLVTGGFYTKLPICETILRVSNMLDIELVKFSAFSSNPRYDEALSGAEWFQKRMCDGILAVGGGSSIDVAKCIKEFLAERGKDSHILLIAVPTTGGTGSESTQFAVLYKEGEKCSIDDPRILPQYVLLDGANLTSLPLEVKRATVCDALSHGIESFWSLNASDQSQKIAKKAIQSILENMEPYWDNDALARENMMKASNLAGQAINMTRTTAAHAMCYKFTSMFGMPHGQAVMLCLPEVWQYLEEHLVDCRDKRGANHLSASLKVLSWCLGSDTSMEAIDFLKRLRKKMGFSVPPGITDNQIELMTGSVNVQRLNNFPVALGREEIRNLYRQIVRGGK